MNPVHGDFKFHGALTRIINLSGLMMQPECSPSTLTRALRGLPH
jgi:hypothetical protein